MTSPSENQAPILEYAGPAPSPDPDFSANGRYLVMRTDCVLPMRCIKCNQPTETAIRKRLFWANTQSEAAGGVSRLIPLVRVVPAMISMFRWFSDLRTLRSPVLTVPICRRHRLFNWIRTVLAYLTFPTALYFLREPFKDQLHLWGIVLAFFVSAILWARPRPIKAVHVGVGYITLAGIGRPFLQSVTSSASSPETFNVATVVNSTESLRDRMAAKKRPQ